MTRSLSLLMVACAACSTLDPIPRGVCGNGLIEPGEDCDSHDATCVACAVTCTAVADCPNAGYACGVDGLCHAPSGVLAPATPPSLFLYDDVRITDVDHDGIGDVLGASKTALTVRYGDKQSALSSSFVIETPPTSGPTAFGDLDGDGSQDAALVTSDGIVAFTSPYGTLTPATSISPLKLGAASAMRALFSVRGVAIGFIVQDPATGAMGLQVVEFPTTGMTIQPGALCALPGADFTTDDFDTYLTTNADTSIDIELAAWTKGAASRHWCVTSIHLDPPNFFTNARPATFNDITPTGAVPTRKPIFANLDTTGNSACPWLIDSDNGAALKAHVGSTVAGVLGNPAHCTVAAATTALPTAPNAVATSAGVGHIPFKPGLPTFAQDVLVLSSSAYIYSSVGPTFFQVYSTERTLDRVVSGDLDGDKAIDAVLSAKDDDDLEVIYRAGGGLTAGFIVYRLDTNGVVTDTQIDDYDGNGDADIAYVENLLGHQSLTVAYSMPGHAFNKVTAAQFDNVVSMVPLQVPDSSDPYGTIGDLLVLEQISSGIALTLLHGSPQQVMLSFFEPRSDSDKTSVMRAVVAGDFVMSTGTTQYRDVLAFQPDGTPVGPAAGVSVYRLDGSINGLDPSDPFNAAPLTTGARGGEHVDGLEDCSISGATTTGTPCIRNAKLLPWSSAASHDVVIGVDRQPTPKAFVLDPWQFTAGGTMTVTDASMLTATVPTNAQVHGSRQLDLDGDGVSDLVLSFAPASNASASGAGLVEVCQMNANGTPRSCTDLLPTIQQVAPKLTTCVDAAPGHFIAVDPIDTPPTVTQLLVLCHDSGAAASIARVVWTGSAYEATLVASNLGPLREIHVGDINGDGVDDVIAIRGDAQSRSLTVLAQCESRDMTCRATGVAP